MQPEAVVVLVELEEPREDAEPIVGGVAYMPPGVDPDELAVARARVFAGYSGWGPGQLEAELEEPCVDRRAAPSRTTSSPPTRTSSGGACSSARAGCSR